MIKNMSSPLIFKSKKSKGNGEDNGEDNGEGQSKEGTTAESNINNDITHGTSASYTSQTLAQILTPSEMYLFMCHANVNSNKIAHLDFFLIFIPIFLSPSPG